MEKEKIRKKGQDTLIVSIIGIAAGIAFIGGDFYGERHHARLFGGTTVVASNEEVVTAGEGVQKATLGFDENQILYDENDNNYTFIFDNYAGLDDSYFEVRYGDDKNSINLVRNYLETGNSEGHMLEFNERVVDSFVAGFGDSNEKDSIFFILEDGSIEYILIERAIRNDDYRTFKIDGLSNIVKHYNANSCSDVTSNCERTVLVQSMDGTIYDLVNYVQ